MTRIYCFLMALITLAWSVTKMQALIIGSDRSGFALAAAILNCSRSTVIHDHIESFKDAKTNILLFPFTYSEYTHIHIDFIDKLNKILLDHPDIKVIWLVRNPIDSMLSYAKHKKTSHDRGLLYWYKSNVVHWYFFESFKTDRRMIVKYEDILKSQIIPSVYMFLDLEYSHQFRTYGDFDQAHHNDSSFSTGKIDIEKLSCYPRSPVEGLHKIWEVYKKTELVKMLKYDNCVQD